MEGDIDGAAQPKPIERLGERWPHAFQRGDFGKEWIEDFWPHDYQQPS